MFDVDRSQPSQDTRDIGDKSVQMISETRASVARTRSASRPNSSGLISRPTTSGSLPKRYFRTRNDSTQRPSCSNAQSTNSPRKHAPQDQDLHPREREGQNEQIHRFLIRRTCQGRQQSTQHVRHQKHRGKLSLI